ncbi:HNH endonuclease [Antribacter sp. KLBMP9083]|uniref:HNH endonuclease n=1 Tax=Antribacter soli TaxID=2910976 RepID=A0AA41QEX1_9MICO|nr:HNH endonuclease [Antribacter soli]MCF4122178.1 HNH endonuclease [Antribacter soli]
MALADLTDPEAVRRAIAEFDAIGRDTFLKRYGFDPAKDYFIVVDDKMYDSKAITGVAHLYQHGELLTADMFSGGSATVANRVGKLGFEVTRPVGLPDWSTDELMLALDLYLRANGKATAQAVADLSAELRSLRIFPDEVRSNDRFRNPSGVTLKLYNFSSIDPAHAGQGMAHGGAGDVRVWEAWAHRPDELREAVALIRAYGATDDAPEATGEEEEYGATEGRILYREHRRYERDRNLVARKKQAVLKKAGSLACEVCDFESSETYDVEGVIDVHHVVPLHKIGVSVTTLNDLALVCPTCHRVLHKHRPIITPAELREKRTEQFGDG